MTKQSILKLALAAAALGSLLASCNTVKGVGQDLGRVGQGVENTADRAAR